jgi:L-iditol 2-dehydrogenase
MRRAQLHQGATVLIFGAGAVGLLCAAVSKYAGAGRVIIADIDAGRVNFAVENSFAHASFVVPMKQGSTIEEKLTIAQETAALLGKIEDVEEVDAVFECTGVEACLQAAIYVRAKPLKSND